MQIKIITLDIDRSRQNNISDKLPRQIRSKRNSETGRSENATKKQLSINAALPYFRNDTSRPFFLDNTWSITGILKNKLGLRIPC